MKGRDTFTVPKGGKQQVVSTAIRSPYPEGAQAAGRIYPGENVTYRRVGVNRFGRDDAPPPGSESEGSSRVPKGCCCRAWYLSEKLL